MTKNNSAITTEQLPEYIQSQFGNTITDVLFKKKSGDQTRDGSDVSAPSQVSISKEDCQALCKEAGIEYQEGYEKRVLSYVCSDESVDRYGDIIRQAGWDLENYKKNPVVMLNHDYTQMPIGSGIKVWVDETTKQLKMWILFPNADVSAEADKAFRLAKNGFMKASSVGFLPKATSELSVKEKEVLGMTPWGVEYTSQELLEHTLCGIPANPNALQEAIAKGIVKREEMDTWVKNKNLITPVPTIETPIIIEEKLDMTNIKALIKTALKELKAEEPIESDTLPENVKTAINDALVAIQNAQNVLNQLLSPMEEETEPDTTPDTEPETLGTEASDTQRKEIDVYELSLLTECFNDTLTQIKKGK